MKATLLILVVCLAGCATNPDGTLTDQSRANLSALEQFALAAAVSVGTQALTTGTVDQATMVNSINQGAAVLQGVIATQNTPKAAKEAIQSTATTKAVKNQLAPEISDAISDAIDKGVPAKQAVSAAASGMKKGAAKLKTKKAK